MLSFIVLHGNEINPVCKEYDECGQKHMGQYICFQRTIQSEAWAYRNISMRATLLLWMASIYLILATVANTDKNAMLYCWRDFSISYQTIYTLPYKHKSLMEEYIYGWHHTSCRLLAVITLCSHITCFLATPLDIYRTLQNTWTRFVVFVHDDVIKWKHFSLYWPMCGNIPVSVNSDAELWCFRWPVPEQTFE